MIKDKGKYSYKEYKKEAKGLSKLKRGFFEAPDKMEQYIEEMEMKGYRLQSISSYGPVLNFRRGEPRRIKCCVDIQVKVNDEYFRLYREAGWKLVYKLNNLLCKYIIWIQEYEEGKDIPHIYSDYESQIKVAKRHLFATSIFTPILIVMIIISLKRALTTTHDIWALMIFSIVLFSTLVDLWNNGRYFIKIRKLKEKQIKI